MSGERLKDAGIWQKHDRDNKAGNPDAMCDMFISAATDGSILGVAYALCLNGSMFSAKGGAR